MMRALWTASSGMQAQQMNVDVISNNLSNVATTGYKKQRVEFKDLLYETVNRATVMNNGTTPVNLQIGHGVMPIGTTRNFSGGNTDKTDNPTDFAIDGDAFFSVNSPKGGIAYTKDGSFKISVTADGKKLATSEGLSVLNDAGGEIALDFDVKKLQVSSDGVLSYIDETGAVVDIGQKLGLFKFPNMSGLESIGGNMYGKTVASGDAFADSESGVKSTVMQGFLEASNVQVVEEMVKLIVAQRAYEINSKAIQSSDEMLGMANTLRR